ncbi:hypothetical protein [Amycolatopsis sp. H20-H5]|uniref:hypothetical protein n=1 Tax=Amycolatopsis sp. H20-H5 TaxID=3046309 RepID=UPI002DB8777D|nr:hypothetical protein [Amycolatopsis sp. H20-H5]MEC3982518.1 hypothetical protein [Amycolatopsis sp. H20-H5]
MEGSYSEEVTTTMTRPTLRIACCLCDEPIPRGSDIYALGKEWQRRFPAMVGILACGQCALSRNVCHCRGPGGTRVAGHHPATHTIDCRSCGDHIEGYGTHPAMVVTQPVSALQQGAEEYLRHVLDRPGGVSADIAQAIQDAFDRRAEPYLHWLEHRIDSENWSHHRST